MQHFLSSDKFEKDICVLGFYDAEKLLKEIKKHLEKYPDDTVTHSREYDEIEKKKYYGGRQIINFYEVNPKTKKPSLCIMKGHKQYYKEI